MLEKTKTPEYSGVFFIVFFTPHGVRADSHYC